MVQLGHVGLLQGELLECAACSRRQFREHQELYVCFGVIHSLEADEAICSHHCNPGVLTARYILVCVLVLGLKNI